ncbi:MAG TPA: TylF/MycF/NovP-related O-methyltransferase [Niabella sp.]
MFAKLNRSIKDIVVVSGLGYLFYPFRKGLLFLYNLSLLTHWIHKHKKLPSNSDYFTWGRHYEKRINGFEYILGRYQLQDKAFLYMEFGVASGVSFEWWLQHARHPEAVFWGFDTFEGLPEKWGVFYKKGAMAHTEKVYVDGRYRLFKGVFQHTLAAVIDENRALMRQAAIKVILLDADLFSSTLFVLSQLYPYLNKGDLIILDEFNVPNHEFYAVKLFQECFYVKLKPVSVLNNFYQTIFEVQ